MTVEPKPPHPALARYRADMKRKRIVYFGIVAAVVAVVLVAVGVAWSRGEITHVTIRTADSPAPSVALQSPSPQLRLAWDSDDRTAIGTPFDGGTVVTYDQHTVRGRDGATGAVTWSYSRSNRTVCDTAQAGGVTVALFELKGNCDQVTTLDTETGERKWTRTLAENDHPIDGRPAIQVLQYTIMLTTPSVIYAIDPISGIDRWQFAQPDCTVNSAVLGSEGALISQTCDNPDCDGKKFCGAGPQLLLRDPTGSRSDTEAGNADRVKWNLLGTTAVPVSADQLISAYEDGTLLVLDPAKGKRRAALDLAPAPGSADAIGQASTTTAELVHLDGYTYAVPFKDSRVLWSARTAAVPTVTATGASQVPALSTSIVAVPDADGIAVLDGASGKAERIYELPDVPLDSSVYPFGTGFVVAGDTTKVYR